MKKKENLFCHCVESPNVTYKSKCVCMNFETTQIVLRMNATENKHDFDPTRTDIMTRELSICDSRNAIRRQPSRNIKKSACLATETVDIPIQNSGNIK